MLKRKGENVKELYVCRFISFVQHKKIYPVLFCCWFCHKSASIFTLSSCCEELYEWIFFLNRNFNGRGFMLNGWFIYTRAIQWMSSKLTQENKLCKFLDYQLELSATRTDKSHKNSTLITECNVIHLNLSVPDLWQTLLSSLAECAARLSTPNYRHSLNRFTFYFIYCSYWFQYRGYLYINCCMICGKCRFSL